MKKIHLYKANSRLGMKFVPIHSNELNLGVEVGPDAMLQNDFLKYLGLPILVDKFDFVFPENIDDNLYYSKIASDSRDFANLVNNTLQDDEIPVIIGGDHSVTYASLLSLFERVNPKNVGYIQFDSHADLNLISTSPTGNFHGMYLRPFVDEFDSKDISNEIKNKLPVENVLFVGNLELDPDEAEFIKTNNIKVIDSNVIKNGQFIVLINDFIHSFDHIHVSFDIDVFDSSIVCATGTPSICGLFWSDVEPILLELSMLDKISIDIVEVNPLKTGHLETVEIARKVILTLTDFSSKED